MRTAKQFYSNPKNRELVRSTSYNRLSRMGKIPEGSRIESGRMAGWYGRHEETEGATPSHEEAPRAVDHKGWFLDSFEEDTACGLVVRVRIPRRRARDERIEADEEGTFSRVRFMEGVRSTWGTDYVSRKSRDLHDTPRDCAVSADEEARAYAEESREADAKYHAEEETKTLRDQIKEDRREIAEIVAERREIKRQAVPDLFREAIPAPRANALCRAISARVGDLKESIAKAQKRIEALENNFWFSVERG